MVLYCYMVESRWLLFFLIPAVDILQIYVCVCVQYGLINKYIRIHWIHPIWLHRKSERLSLSLQFLLASFFFFLSCSICPGLFSSSLFSRRWTMRQMDGWMLQWSTADLLFTFSLFFYFSRVITYTSLHRRPVLVVCLFSMTFYYYYYYYILMIIVARSSGGWVTTRWSGCCSCGIPTFSHNIWKGKTSFRVCVSHSIDCVSLYSNNIGNKTVMMMSS